MKKIKIKFVSWRQLEEGTFEADYLFQRGERKDIIAIGQLLSTRALKGLGIPIPRTPTYCEWREKVESRTKCGKCYRTLRGTREDLKRHRCLVSFS